MYANVVVPARFNIDSFFDPGFRASVMPACGTYYSGLDDGFQPGCNLATAAGLPDPRPPSRSRPRTTTTASFTRTASTQTGPERATQTRKPSWDKSGWACPFESSSSRSPRKSAYTTGLHKPLPNNLLPVVSRALHVCAINTNYSQSSRSR